MPAERVPQLEGPTLTLAALTHLFPQFTKLFCFPAKNLFGRVLEARDPVVVGEVRKVDLRTQTSLAHTQTFISR